VTLIQRSSHVLHDFDTDAAAELEKVFRGEGITVFTNTKLIDARREDNLKAVYFEYEGKTIRVAAEEILFGLGRTPNTSRAVLPSAPATSRGPGRSSATR
jgi:pyruvate/2-oxoglutarate dehydrogenase complex dihydrolipoamide dehydrogenase (E3) component